jgi:DNA-binding NarL/FixJ family response regulator
MTITILLADDHEIFRQGLHLILSNQPDFTVVGQAVNGLEAVSMAERLRPDVVIVDMMMPGLGGAEVTHKIKQRLPDCRVVVLSMHDDESYILSALQNGANGYVLKDLSTADLVQAVRWAMAGQRFLSPPITERAIQAYIRQADKKGGEDYNTLTQREREVLNLAANGLTSAEIARQLVVSVRTVETHRANLMHKLNLHSQLDLVNFARKQGIVPPE